MHKETLFHDRSNMDKDAFAPVNYFFYFSFLLLFFTITFTPKPYPGW